MTIPFEWHARNAWYRRCVTGKATWRTDDAGGVVIEAGERLTRFSQDDPLFMGWGWGKVYVLTPCTEEHTATFVTPNVDYSG